MGISLLTRGRITVLLHIPYIFRRRDDRDRRIAQEGFGAGRRKPPNTRCRPTADKRRCQNEPSFSSNSTSASEIDVPQTGHQLTMRSPLIDKSFIVKVNKDLLDGLLQPSSISETLAFPVARGTHFLLLFVYSPAKAFLPLPRAFKKGVTADVALGYTLLLHGFDYSRFGWRLRRGRFREATARNSPAYGVYG